MNVRCYIDRVHLIENLAQETLHSLIFRTI